MIQNLNDMQFSELIISDVNRDGSLRGLDNELIKFVLQRSKKLNLFSGGIKNYEEIRKLSKNDEISGIIIGTFFSLYGNLKTPLIHYLNDSQKKKISKI